MAGFAFLHVVKIGSQLQFIYIFLVQTITNSAIVNTPEFGKYVFIFL